MSALMTAAGSEIAAADRPRLRSASALRLERLGDVSAVAASAIGLTVLIGYWTRTASVVRLSPGLPPMYPNAAIGLVAGGVAVITCRRAHVWRVVAAAGTALVGAIGAIGLWLHVGDDGPTWFEGLFPDDFVTSTTPVGGRPAVETCVAFVLLAVALVSLTARRAAAVGQALAVAGTAVGLAAVVGYVLGVDRTSLGSELVYVGMALHTGLGIALVGLGAVLVRPNVGVLAQLLDGGFAGVVTRRVTLAVAAAPAVLIATGFALSHLLPNDDLSQSVFSVLQIGVLSAAVLIPASIIAPTEQKLREQLDAARRRDEHTRDVDTVVEAITHEMVVVVPDVPGWEIGMRYQPATGHLAGDSVHVHHRTAPRPETLIAIIDIAGHDAYAAVVAYGLRAHIGALWEHGAELSSIAASANTKLLRRRTIASGVLLAFEHGSEEVRLVNAGHPPPIHLHAGHVTTWPLTGPLFGIEGGQPDVRSYDVESSDVIVAYTDGLTEARSGSGDQLGEKTIQRLVLSWRDGSPSDIADACMNAAMQHTAARLSDDALVVVARRH